MNQADRVRAKLLQLIAGASDDELFKINNTLAEAGHLNLDRCRKLGSPFPLFDLPLELLEHSARYLSRQEAAPMITVNRLFHDVFARVVWRCISARQIKKSKIQLSALSRYGHLVNQLHIDAERFAVASIASLVPNVMSVSIYNNKSGSKIQAGRLDLLRNLRAVDISLYDLSEKIFGSLGNWINNDSLSGHINEIELSFLDAEEWLKEILSFYNSIINKKRVRISFPHLASGIPKSLIVGMASSLTHLEICVPTCSGRHLDKIYRSSNAIFPLVTRLHISVCCAGHMENSLLGMTSERFSSVRTLRIRVTDKECVYQNGSPLPIILSRSWPSVTQLNLAGNIKRDDHSYIASALPNLITLNYSSNADSHDLADLVPKFKFLQVLALDNYYREHNPEPSTIIMPKKVMNRLRLIKVYKLTLTVDMVRFIFYFCPDLVELNLDDCTVSKDVIEHANRISRTMKSPVRQLKLMGFSQTKPDLWVEFISEFRNLKEIFIDNACAGADHLEVVLTERLSHVKVTQYRG